MRTCSPTLIICLLLLGLFACQASANISAKAFSAFADEETIPAAPVYAESVTPTENDDGGLFGRIKGGFGLHKENYLLPLTWSSSAHSSEDAELKFQMSFKQQIYDGFNFAYTQRSFWRVLDQANSRPFRETTYNPELFYRFQALAGERIGWGLDLGVEHESNGRQEPNSRSWNRVYIAPSIEHGPLRVELKLWNRISEKVKRTPDDPTGDENPDIEKFYGYGELRFSYVNSYQHQISLMTRWNFASDKGALQFGYSVPTGTKNLFLYGQLWTGYGESMIDYNRSVTRSGIGMLISH